MAQSMEREHMAKGKRLRIGIDLDGVVCAFATAACNYFNKTFGTNVHPTAQTSWDFSSLGITQEQDDALWNHIHSTPNWWLTLPKENGTYRLGEVCRNHDVFFITHRKQETVGMPIQIQSAIWLEDAHDISYPTVIATKNKGLVALALDLDFFIDDKDSNLADVGTQSKYTKLHVKHQPYNLHVTDVPRVQTLNDFLEAIGACQPAPEQPQILQPRNW